MGDDDLTNADKEALLEKAGWLEDAITARWYHDAKGLVAETLEEAYRMEFPEE